jgi:hypothetical protein
MPSSNQKYFGAPCCLETSTEKMSTPAPSCRRYCGLSLLAVFALFEFGAFIAGAAFVNSAATCVGGAGALSLPVWILVGALIGFFFNLLFFCFFLINCTVCAQGTRDNDGIYHFLFCCVIGGPAALLMFVSFLFRLAWFITGIVLYDQLSMGCKTDFANLYVLGIVLFITMAFSSTAKALVISKECNECD